MVVTFLESRNIAERRKDNARIYVKTYKSQITVDLKNNQKEYESIIYRETDY